MDKNQAELLRSIKRVICDAITYLLITYLLIYSQSVKNDIISIWGLFNSNETPSKASIFVFCN